MTSAVQRRPPVCALTFHGHPTRGISSDNLLPSSSFPLIDSRHSLPQEQDTRSTRILSRSPPSERPQCLRPASVCPFSQSVRSRKHKTDFRNVFAYRQSLSSTPDKVLFRMRSDHSLNEQAYHGQQGEQCSPGCKLLRNSIARPDQQYERPEHEPNCSVKCNKPPSRCPPPHDPSSCH